MEGQILRIVRATTGRVGVAGRDELKKSAGPAVAKVTDAGAVIEAGAGTGETRASAPDALSQQPDSADRPLEGQQSSIACSISVKQGQIAASAVRNVTARRVRLTPPRDGFNKCLHSRFSTRGRNGTMSRMIHGAKETAAPV